MDTKVMRDEKMEPVDKRDFDYQSWEKAARLLDAFKHVQGLTNSAPDIRTGRFLGFHFGLGDGCEQCQTERILILDFLMGEFSLIERRRGTKIVKHLAGKTPSELGILENGFQITKP